MARTGFWVSSTRLYATTRFSRMSQVTYYFRHRKMGRYRLPIFATLLIPADDSYSLIATTITIDPYIFPYHIVPQRLSFADLG
ncbi:hypothetical protein JCGZ_17341 [Jatropha curcas]|uniref:Uncharacterized protein n=1 Tax=Jatropha curcas TaxID=180498 RepID=A0A067LMV1_JATCU|nr:hypothetical protein JCGZ_17341 [Jatropha curcas]